MRDVVWAGRREGGGVCSMQTRARLGIGGRARAERTRNMSLMSVTLDVSRLSGWLNADADCRVERRAYEAGSMRAGRGRGAAAAQASCRRGPNCGSCWEGTRRAHPKHVLHVCDFGRVEAQRLVERRGTLPSRKGSMRSGARCGPGEGRAVERRRRKMHAGECPAGDWAQGRRQSAPETWSSWM